MKIKEKFSLQLAKNPGSVVLAFIFLFNILFFIISALIISSLSLTGTESLSFIEAAFYTITMILDAGCISYVIADIGQSGIVIAIVCLLIILIGMISFTGAVIGYLTNSISNFIENSNTGNRSLTISNHLVILNWNTRASEIVNDLLYLKGNQKVVVLSDSSKTDIIKEIDERISDTIVRENNALWRQCEDMPLMERRRYWQANRLKNNVTVIVRQGDVFSAKQLHDIALEKARSVVILGNDTNNTQCKYGLKEHNRNRAKGNPQTIKTLMLVSDITAADYSEDNQKIIVEISDDWTWDLVNRIINYKQVDSKCNIVPVRVNQILGRILSQFCLMPELNLAYTEFFSNKGTTFYVEQREVREDDEYISEYLSTHRSAIPLTSMVSKGSQYFFYSSGSQEDISIRETVPPSSYSVKLCPDYWIETKNVIILGHNSKCKDIMQGFVSFCDEWDYKNSIYNILHVIVIDEPENLDKMDHYREYPFVLDTIPATVYDKDLICDTIEAFVDDNEEDTSILILSDDTAAEEDIDANALAYLIYVQDIIDSRKRNIPNFDTDSIDVIVEILNPKHYDLVSSYSVDNVIISNRYISKMVTQIGEKEAIFDFYNDILQYDDLDSQSYSSKEVYIKKVSTFFSELPGECTEEELIRAVWEASVHPAVQGNIYPTIVLGYVKPGGKMVLFKGDQSRRRVRLEKDDKIVVFSNH